MNRDIENAFGSDSRAKELLAALANAPQMRAGDAFQARVMAEIRASRCRSWFSAPALFAAAAAGIAAIATFSIFLRPVPKPSLAAWAVPEVSVRIAPYDPAEWYLPVDCAKLLAESAASQSAGGEAAPLCSVEALARLSPARGR